VAGNHEPQTIELSLRPAQSYSLFLTFRLSFFKEASNGGVDAGASHNFHKRRRLCASRPMTCSPPPFIETAAAVATLLFVNFIFITPKFAFAQLSGSRRMARKVYRENSLIFTRAVGRDKSFEFSNESSNLCFPRCHREAAND